MILYYNNASGPAPQGNSMFLYIEGWEANILGISK